MASDLTVQTIRGPGSGANANKILIPSGQTLDASSGAINPPAGSIVQTVFFQATRGGEWQVGTTAYSISDLTVSITPKYNNSLLIITAIFNGKHYGSSQNNDGSVWQFYRDGTTIKSAAGHQFEYSDGVTGWGAANKHYTVSMRASVTSSSTNQTTFAVAAKVFAGGATFINYDWGINTIRVEEVKQ